MKAKTTPTKKHTAKIVAIAALIAAATTGGVIVWLNRDADPTTFKGERSGYEETK